MVGGGEGKSRYRNNITKEPRAGNLSEKFIMEHGVFTRE